MLMLSVLFEDIVQLIIEFLNYRDVEATQTAYYEFNREKGTMLGDAWTSIFRKANVRLNHTIRGAGDIQVSWSCISHLYIIHEMPLSNWRCIGETYRPIDKFVRRGNTLKHVTICHGIDPLMIFELRNMHELESLTLDGNGTVGLDLLNNFNEFPYLKHLELKNFRARDASLLKKLPKTLVSLSLHQMMDGKMQSPPNLDLPNLVSLTIHYCSNGNLVTDSLIKSLPDTLEKLSIIGISKLSRGALNSAPSGLKELEINGHVVSGSLKRIRELNLTSLSIYHATNLRGFESLPLRRLSLDASVIDMRLAKHLKEKFRLCELQIQESTLDKGVLSIMSEIPSLIIFRCTVREDEKGLLKELCSLPKQRIQHYNTYFASVLI